MAGHRMRARACHGWCVAAWLVLAAPALVTAQDPAPQEGAPAQDTPIGEAPEEREAEDIFLRGQRVLLGRGDVVLDFGQFYSRSDTLQLALIDGAVALATREQTVLTTVLVGRLGIGAETEVFGGASFMRQKNRLFLDSTNLAETTSRDVGDVALGVRHTLLREAPGRPDVIATFDGTVPTGRTPYVLGGGLVFVKSVDPVVLFAGVTYHRSLGRDRPDGTRLEPGNGAGVSLGYGLALNDSLAISTVASAVFIRPPAAQGESRRIDLFSLRFALTAALVRGVFLEPSVSMGLSGPGQSFALGVTLPYSF